MSSADPRPGARGLLAGLRRADRVAKASLARAGRWALQPRSHLRPHSGRSLRASLESIEPRAPAPSTQLQRPQVSGGDARAPPPPPPPPATSQGQRQCAAVSAAGGLGVAPTKGAKPFSGRICKKFPLVVSSPCWSIIAVPSPPPHTHPPFPFSTDLIFQGKQTPTALCSSLGPTCLAGGGGGKGRCGGEALTLRLSLRSAPDRDSTPTFQSFHLRKGKEGKGRIKARPGEVWVR